MPSVSAGVPPLLVAEIVRVVSPGDPHQPLGGIGVRFTRLVSESGLEPALRVWNSLFRSPWNGHRGVRGPLAIELPTGRLVRLEDQEELDFEDEPTKSVSVDEPVFLRAGNIILRARLSRLSSHQAVIEGVRIAPETGSLVQVRMLSANHTQQRGLQLSGTVDMVHAVHGLHVLSISLDTAHEATSVGGLRAFLRAAQDTMATDPSGELT